MALISFVSGDSQFELVIGYLTGACLLITSMCVVVGIVLMYHTHGNSDHYQGKAGPILPQNLSRPLNGLLHGRGVQRCTLLFLALGMVSSVVIIVLVALAVPCLCFGTANRTGIVIAALFLLVIAVTNFVHK
jgi:hypothetical protein